MEQTEIPTEQELRDLGFEAAADETKSKRELARKLRIAFEHFRVVLPEQIARFNTELARKTSNSTPSRDNPLGYPIHQRLAFTSTKHYAGVPPKEVLEELKKARELNCFDSFEIATIESVVKVPDPVLFGVIDGCDNKYFIAQWDNDVSIEQILRPEEG